MTNWLIAILLLAFLAFVVGAKVSQATQASHLNPDSTWGFNNLPEPDESDEGGAGIYIGDSGPS